MPPRQKPQSEGLVFKATVTPEQMRLDLRFVTSVENPAASATPKARGSSRIAGPARFAPDLAGALE
jgi:hypothetical protein